MNIKMHVEVPANALTEIHATGKYHNNGNLLPMPYVVAKVPTPGMPDSLCPVQASFPELNGERISAFKIFRLANEKNVPIVGVYGLTAFQYDFPTRKYVPVVTVYADKGTAERLYRFTKSRWEWEYAEGTLSVGRKEAIYVETAEKFLTEIFN